MKYITGSRPPKQQISHYDPTEENPPDTKAMSTTRWPCDPTTTTDALKLIAQRNSNKTLKNTTTTPSTRNSAPKSVTVIGTDRARVELLLGAD
jgi:hypothetical protein